MRLVTRITGTGSRDEYITITQEYKGRRELTQGRIQEFKKGGSFKRVRAERAEKFRVTTPTFAKPLTTPIFIKTRLHELYLMTVI